MSERWRIAANLGLLSIWIWFFRPVYSYLKVIFTREEFRSNQVVLLGVIFLIFLQVRKGDLRPRISQLPQLYFPAIVLVMIGSILFLVNERFLDINTLSASMFALASYGLLGLWMRPQRWKEGLPAALLLTGALPFGEHMQTFIGYPVRILTAALVRDGLAAVGVHSIGVDTILIFENGFSQVDLPCSGVKSLWTGGLFLIALTWINRQPINLRWFLIALLFAVLLLAGNLGRVAILVIIGQVFEWTLLAEIMHVPLGVLGFVAACTAVVWLHRHTSDMYDEPDQELDGSNYVFRPAWLLPVLSALVLLMSLLYAPRENIAAAQEPTGWHLPDSLQVDPWPLAPEAMDWLAQVGADSADRFRFHWNDRTGSILLVSSATWRGQHRPERCFAVYGLEVNDSQTYLVEPDFPLRMLTLGQDRQSGLFSAVYWLQSADRVTDDYAVRIWSDMIPERQSWVQVTVLFDDTSNPISDGSIELYDILRQSVKRSFEGGS
jgi:exosortase O